MKGASMFSFPGRLGFALLLLPVAALAQAELSTEILAQMASADQHCADTSDAAFDSDWCKGFRVGKVFASQTVGGIAPLADAGTAPTPDGGLVVVPPGGAVFNRSGHIGQLLEQGLNLPPDNGAAKN